MLFLSLALSIGPSFPSFVKCAEAADDDRATPVICSYDMQVWNVNAARVVKTEKVNHPYAALIPEEIDSSTGCTVCSEDQETVNVPPLPPFSICYKLARKVHSAMRNLVQDDELLHSVVGYHVIKSRGPVDGKGDRTGFSNHSFGTAIDINPEQNGLYDNCIEFGPQCRLLRGGEWRPGTPGTLDRNSAVVSLFRRAGFHWGGEIAGKQKDFMHFSLTGY